jgi:hypothetical protein
MDEHKVYFKSLSIFQNPQHKYWSFLYSDHIDDHRKSIGMPRIMEYLPGSAQWHGRLEAECYFIAGECI